ncbi:MAG: hypothetical protein HY870_21470 [Chloroflexi bacterium]|nr:hypothetical protein [Chloroflexota bacterium]
MKKVKDRQSDQDMRPEYDFTGKPGVRGKYYRAYQQGHLVRIHETDGTVTLRYFTLEDGAVLLEPDVREYFPNSEAVNTALRSLIALIPGKATRPKQAPRSRRTKVSA